MATKKRKAAPAIKARRVFLGKGLSRDAAWRKARTLRGPDFRAFSYSATTGYASLL